MSTILACKHEDPNKMIATNDGERVCPCGVVIEDGLPEENSTYRVFNPMIHHKELGSNPSDAKKVVKRNIHVYTSSLSEFSNVCSKLRLPMFIQNRSWSIYHKLRTRTIFKRGRCATFAIYTACRESGVPVSEARIKDAVKSVMGIKDTPHMVNVIYNMREDALLIGIDTNSGHSVEYYLYQIMSSVQHVFESSVDYDRFKIHVMNRLPCLEGNPLERATRAVFVILTEMGEI